jgi:hypothetical protein
MPRRWISAWAFAPSCGCTGLQEISTNNRFCGWRNKFSVSVSVSVIVITTSHDILYLRRIHTQHLVCSVCAGIHHVWVSSQDSAAILRCLREKGLRDDVKRKGISSCVNLRKSQNGTTLEILDCQLGTHFYRHESEGPKHKASVNFAMQWMLGCTLAWKSWFEYYFHTLNFKPFWKYNIRTLFTIFILIMLFYNFFLKLACRLWASKECKNT